MPMRIDPERLRLALEVLGLSQGDLARASGVSRTTISRILSGQRFPSQEKSVRLMAGMEKAFRQKDCRLDCSFFVRDEADGGAENPRQHDP